MDIDRRPRGDAEPGRHARAFLPLLVVLALGVGACGSGSAQLSPAVDPTSAGMPTAPVSTATASVTPASSLPAGSDSASSSAVAGPIVHLVAMGDSVPFEAFCPGCEGFVDRYASDLHERTGLPVEVRNRSRNDSAGLPELVEQVQSEARLREELAASDVVIVSIGFNNVLPDPGAQAKIASRYGGDWGCTGDPGATARSYTEWLLTDTSRECLDQQRAAFATLYDKVFSTITELPAGRPGVLAALQVYDANLHGQDIESSGVAPRDLKKLWPLMIKLYDDWNAMLCDRAEARGFTCVDIYHPFNGPDGDKAIGALSVDGSHPSQDGNDLIARVLGELDISSLRPK